MSATGTSGLRVADCGLWIWLLAVAALLVLPASAAEQFGHIFVSPQSTVPGATHHGYRELRVIVENRSPRETSRVMLTFPEHAYGRGNSIRRISRSVVIGPGARAIVPLWQPALPADGNSQLRVHINGELAGALSFPHAPQHMSSRYYGSHGLATILVSRSVDFDEVSRVLKRNSPAASHSASAATGPPSSSRSYGVVATAWTPNPSHSGPHWLEVDFDQPVAADRVSIHETSSLPGGELILIGVSRTNIARVTIATPSRPGRPAVTDVSFRLTPEPVASVRLEFPAGTYGGQLSIDAVQLSGPSGSSWASAARASSEGTAAYGSPAETVELLRSEVPAVEWSEQWLSYTAFDGVVASAADLNTMTPAGAEALWRYTEAGGTLLLIGGNETHLPATWQKIARRSSLRGSQPVAVGFGKCFLFPATIGEVNDTASRVVYSALLDSARLWDSRLGEEAANSVFPVVENARVPVRGTVFAMLTFVLLIGPVNLFVLSRMKRRTWMLWTVPAISFATCLLVFGYTFVREGVTSDVRIEGFTLLDQSTRRATSLGISAFYCPLTPGGGLMFSPETEVTPLVETDWHSSGSRREMDWSSAQHLERGWVTARVPAHFEMRKSETRRERLQVEMENGRLTVLNGLGAHIQALWLADASGAIYSATNIPAGQKAALAPFADYPRVVGDPDLPQRPSTGFASSPARSLLTPHPGGLLRAGSYVAELNGNPFLENGLARRATSSRVKAHAVVYGLLEP